MLFLFFYTYDRIYPKKYSPNTKERFTNFYGYYNAGNWKCDGN